MENIVTRLRGVEDRLRRIMTSGWRHVPDEAASLRQEAADLAEAGMPELAKRLAAAASGPEAAVAGSLSLALASVRLLRVHLEPDTPPPGAWQPLAAPMKRKAPVPDLLLPVGQIADTWACVRLPGSHAADLVLVTPPAGLAEPLWLQRGLTGYLRWTARVPLGAAGDVQVCAIIDPQEVALEPDRSLEAFFAAAAGHALKEDQVVLASGRLRVRQLHPEDRQTYIWLDPPAGQRLEQARWVLVWVDGATVVPLTMPDRDLTR